jgi:hypothetical protein
MKLPDSSFSDEDGLHIFSQRDKKSVSPAADGFQSPVEIAAENILTLEEACVALEAVQRLNSKLEVENASLRERVALLDKLVVKLLKKKNRLAN